VHESLKKLILYLPVLLLSPWISSGQTGGNSTYEFLNLTTSARIAGMGGNFLAIKDNDITLSLTNPSLITEEMHNDLAFSFVNYFRDLNYGYLMYSRTFKKAGSFTGTFQFVDYGKFTRADETGVTYGEFSASEYALNIGWGRKLSSHFSIGANGKLIYSAFDTYHSFGIAVDVAGTYVTKEDLFTASLIARNIGIQIVPYYAGNSEPLPFELQAGASVRFRHIPLRFSFLYNHIEKWDLSYDDPTNPDNQKDPVTGETQEKSGISRFADNMMHHIVLGGEVTIAKVFSIRLGYNYQRRQELKIYNHAARSGFSLGVGLRIKMFSVSYTRATYMSGKINPNYFTFTCNLQQFSKKK
jgi:hypothetical protein